MSVSYKYTTTACLHPLQGLKEQNIQVSKLKRQPHADIRIFLEQIKSPDPLDTLTHTSKTVLGGFVLFFKSSPLFGKEKKTKYNQTAYLVALQSLFTEMH